MPAAGRRRSSTIDPRLDAATAGTTMPMGIPPTPHAPPSSSPFAVSAAEGWDEEGEVDEEPDPPCPCGWGRGGGWNPATSLSVPVVLLAATPMMPAVAAASRMDLAVAAAAVGRRRRRRRRGLAVLCASFVVAVVGPAGGGAGPAAAGGMLRFTVEKPVRGMVGWSIISRLDRSNIDRGRGERRGTRTNASGWDMHTFRPRSADVSKPGIPPPRGEGGSFASFDAASGVGIYSGARGRSIDLLLVVIDWGLDAQILSCLADPSQSIDPHAHRTAGAGHARVLGPAADRALAQPAAPPR